MSSKNTLTFTEWHAAVVGGVFGALAAYLRRIQYTEAGVLLAVVFVLTALGVTWYAKSSATRTVTKEPWYGLGAFLAAGAAVLVVT